MEIVNSIGILLDTLKNYIKLFANSGDPDKTPHSAVSDLGLYYLSVTLSGVSRLKWFNQWFLCCISGGFVCDICFVLVCSSSLLKKPRLYNFDTL